MGLEYIRLHWEASAGFRRTVTPSFYGESVTRDQVKVFVRYEASQKLDLNLTATYTLSGTSGVLESKRKSEGFFIQPTANYLLLKDLVLQLGGNFNHNKNRENGLSKNRFRAWTQLTWELPFFLH
ncbi:MAG: hypothetical protein ACOCVM_01370 [Desulfovibrionaceae bacterium]